MTAVKREIVPIQMTPFLWRLKSTGGSQVPRSLQGQYTSKDQALKTLENFKAMAIAKAIANTRTRTKKVANA